MGRDGKGELIVKSLLPPWIVGRQVFNIRTRYADDTDWADLNGLNMLNPFKSASFAYLVLFYKLVHVLSALNYLHHCPEGCKPDYKLARGETLGLLIINTLFSSPVKTKQETRIILLRPYRAFIINVTWQRNL